MNRSIALDTYFGGSIMSVNTIKKIDFKFMLLTLTLVVLSCMVGFLSSVANAAEEKEGELTVTLAHYLDISEQLKHLHAAPINYGMGIADVSLTGKEQDERYTAEVVNRVTLEVFEDRWTAIPLIQNTLPLSSVKVNGRKVQLSRANQQWYWVTQKKGKYQLELRYGLDSMKGQFYVPILEASTQFSAVIPFGGERIQVTPSSQLTIATKANVHTVQASIPATSFLVLAWDGNEASGYAFNKASYNALLEKESLRIDSEYQVSVKGEDPVWIPLFSDSQIVQRIELDGKEVPLQRKGSQLMISVKGQGTHTIRARLAAIVTEQNGIPSTRLLVPVVPINQLTMKLPGEKEILVEQAANVASIFTDEHTTASTYLPATDRIVMSWQEAVPEEVEASLRANATNYHLFSAQEGVLHASTHVDYEITRGETSQLKIALPLTAQVNRVAGLEGTLVDWRTESIQPEKGKSEQQLTLFFNRPLTKGDYKFQIDYEMLLSASVLAGTQASSQQDLTRGPNQKSDFKLPLISLEGVSRQRGMVALLASTDYTLEPTLAEGANKVGENQLPAEIRKLIKLKVAHTYKYSSTKYTVAAPKLMAIVEVPIREEGKFDAVVDTLLSIGDVTLVGNSSVEINVKSGALMFLKVRLPVNVNVLSLTSPALRSYEVEKAENGTDFLNVAFTQEMQGQFRMDIHYERIMSEGVTEISAPTLGVINAEVEHGRVAIEALAAVEVKALQFEHLTHVEAGELPRQLILKTTNPILMAYRYVNPAINLLLGITRHQEVQTLAANIDVAAYQSLVTADGLIITRASYRVKNNRRQFMRMALPEKSEIWSLAVDGKAEKPAITATTDNQVNILIKLVNSDKGFPLELVYATPIAAMGNFGSQTLTLPQPDMVITQTGWDLYLPENYQYAGITSNLDRMPPHRVYAGNDAVALQQAQAGPIAVNVPFQGVHFGFHKLYASQIEGGVYIKLRYFPEGVVNWIYILMSVAGVVLLLTIWVKRKTKHV